MLVLETNSLGHHSLPLIFFPNAMKANAEWDRLASPFVFHRKTSCLKQQEGERGEELMTVFCLLMCVSWEFHSVALNWIQDCKHTCILLSVRSFKLHSGLAWPKIITDGLIPTMMSFVSFEVAGHILSLGCASAQTQSLQQALML